MPTTSPAIARTVLTTLRSAGVDFALLQDPAALTQDTPTGDIDIVIDRPPSSALSLALHELEPKGIRLVALWPYDIGGAATAFFFDSDGTSGAQIDMLYDPHGLGHYHVRSSVLLEAAQPSDPFSTIAPPALSIYQFSKRRWKGQRERLRSIQSGIRVDHEFLDLVGRLVTSSSLANALVGQEQHIRRRALVPLAVSHIGRFVIRVRIPVGFWIHLNDASSSLAEDLANQLGRVLVRSVVATSPSSLVRAWWWYWRVVQPVRLRPGVVVSSGRRPNAGGPPPDLIIDNATSPAAQVVEAMAKRFCGA